MWHDINSAQMRHPSLTPYQHYSTAQIPHNYHQNGNSKWNNASGQRSAYSLPHPSHAQSNMRWKNQYQSPSPTPRPLSSSTRDLAGTPPNPSFLHSSSHDLRYGNYNSVEGGGSGGGVSRPRPASMYDTPQMMNSMPALNYHHFQQQQQQKHHHQQQHQQLQQQQNSKKSNKQIPRNNSMEMRQSPDELVRLSK